MDTTAKPTQTPQEGATDTGNPTTSKPEATKAQEQLEKEKEVNLKKEAEEKIKSYKLKHGNYRILIRILEANDLVPR